MYNKTVLDHFQNPRNLQEMPHPDAMGMGAHSICGDVMRLYLNIKNDHIQKVAFQPMGCGAAIASGSILTELLEGKSLEEAKKLTPADLVKALGGLPAIKLHCPELAIEALNTAIKSYKKKKSPHPVTK